MALFEIDESSGLPVWVQLRNRFVYLIKTGHYQPGDQLPSVRTLAAEAAINYNTVNKAYLSLVSDGYLESTRGRGVFVRDLDAEMDEEYTKDVDGIMSDCVAACRGPRIVVGRRAEVHDQEDQADQEGRGPRTPARASRGRGGSCRSTWGTTARKARTGA